jgi:rubrerythrin
MTKDTTNNQIFNLIVDGSREKIISILKYRKLASSLEHIYGSRELTKILEDEEGHAKLFLELAKSLNIDYAEIGEQAIIKEIKLMADDEFKMAKGYMELKKSGKITNERVLELLNSVAKESSRHHSILIELSDKLMNKFSKNQ